VTDLMVFSLTAVLLDVWLIGLGPERCAGLANDSWLSASHAFRHLSHVESECVLFCDI
jgi:hypothetical protein